MLQQLLHYVFDKHSRADAKSTRYIKLDIATNIIHAPV